MLKELLRLQNKNPRKVIGLMSGTSVDGIDACLADISGNGTDTKVRVLAFDTYPYDAATRTAILDSCNPATGTVDKICPLNFLPGKTVCRSSQINCCKGRALLLRTLTSSARMDRRFITCRTPNRQHIRVVHDLRFKSASRP